MAAKSRLSEVRVDTLDDDQPLGRHLILLFRAFESEVVIDLHANGFQDVTESDLNILRFVRPEGSRSVEIARLAGITKQAVGKSVQSLEDRGYLRRTTDPSDRRAQVIAFTERGERLINVGISRIVQIERRYSRLLGAAQFRDLKSELRKLFEDHQRRHSDEDV